MFSHRQIFIFIPDSSGAASLNKSLKKKRLKKVQRCVCLILADGC